MTCILDEDNLFEVMDEISSLDSRYYDIGMGLRLNLSELDSIEESFHRNPRRALTRVVVAWLQKKYNVQKFGPPTWRMLVKAVDRPAGGNDHNLAKKIAANHPVG